MASSGSLGGRRKDTAAAAAIPRRAGAQPPADHAPAAPHPRRAAPAMIVTRNAPRVRPPARSRASPSNAGDTRQRTR